MKTPLLLFTFLAPFIAGELEECHPGLSFPGVTLPRGTINLVEGSTLEIYCILNLTADLVVQNNLASHAIDFEVKPKDKLHKLNLDIKSSISVVNKTTAVLRLPNLKKDRYVVDCDLTLPNTTEKKLVCQNIVNIGSLPQDVSNFTCVAKYTDSLNCTWDIKENPTATKYELTYSVKTDQWIKIDYLSRGFKNITCAKTSKNTCELTKQNKTYLFPFKPIYYFDFNATNILKPDGIIYTHEIDHHAIVIPEPPKIKRVEGTSPKTLDVTWDFNFMTYFKGGLTHRIIICVEGDSEKCNDPIFYKTKIGVGNYSKKFDVDYPFTNYTVNITMKSQSAEDSSLFWSKNDTGYGQTKPTIPEFPPETEFGSFSMRTEPFNKTKTNYHFYWKEMPHLFWNGPNFSYIVFVKNNENVKVKEEILPNNAFSYSFTGQPNTEYHFEISSMNSEGKNSKSSHIRVSKNASFKTQPKKVSKIEYNNKTTLVRWSQPASSEFKLISYTLFHCVKHRTKSECSKEFNWTALNSSTEYFVNLNESEATLHYFGVSANYGEFSSGITWTSCNLFDDQESSDSLKNVRVLRDSINSILVQWDQECTYPSNFLKGYKISYCRVMYQTTNETCLESPPLTKTVNGDDISSYKLKELNFTSTYKIVVSVLYNSFDGRPSGSRFATTDLHTFLNSPVIVSVTNITNSRATVNFTENNKFLDATAKFFVLKLQRVGFNESITKHYMPLNIDSETTTYQYEIADLYGSTNYSLTLQMGTTMNSNLSNSSSPAFFETKIGPSFFDVSQDSQIPTIETSIGQGHMITWSYPAYPGGQIKSFEIRIFKDGEFFKSRNISIPDPAKSGPGKKYFEKFDDLLCDKSNITAQVRAFTILNQYEEIGGTWSKEGRALCLGTRNIVPFVIVGCLAGFVLLIIVIILSIRCWDKLNRMMDINPKLPPFIEEVSMQRKSRKSSGGDTRPFDQKETDSVLIQMKQTYTSDSNEDRNSELPMEKGGLSVMSEGGSEDLRRPIPLHEVPNENDKMTAWLWQLSHNNSQPPEMEKPPLPNLQPLHGEESYLIGTHNQCNPLLNGQPEDENTESEETNSDLLNKEKPPYLNGHATSVATSNPSYANFGAGVSRTEKPIPDVVSPSTQYISLEKVSQMKGEPQERPYSQFSFN